MLQTPRFALLMGVLLSACDSTSDPNTDLTNSLKEFRPSVFAFGEYVVNDDLKIGSTTGRVGIVLASGDPNSCSSGLMDGEPYLEIQLFSSDSNSNQPYVFRDGVYPISNELILSPSSSGYFSSTATYANAGDQNNALSVSGNDGASGSVTVSNLDSDHLILNYEITIPNVGQIQGSGMAIFCQKYQDAVQDRFNQPLSQPG
jgi:hypothetical protein